MKKLLLLCLALVACTKDSPTEPTDPACRGIVRTSTGFGFEWRGQIFPFPASVDTIGLALRCDL